MARITKSNFVQKMENGEFWVEEEPIGAINGSNTSYTLSKAPNPVSSAELEINGQTVKYGGTEDFTISGKALSTVYAYPSATGIWIRYRIEP